MSPRFILSWYIAELFAILIHYRTNPYLITFANYIISYYVVELKPISWHCRAIFQLDNKSQQYPQAYLTIRMGGGQQQVCLKFSGKKPVCSKKGSHTVPKMSHETSLRIFREYKIPESTLIRYLISLSIFIHYRKFSLF